MPETTTQALPGAVVPPPATKPTWVQALLLKMAVPALLIGTGFIVGYMLTRSKKKGVLQ